MHHFDRLNGGRLDCVLLEPVLTHLHDGLFPVQNTARVEHPLSRINCGGPDSLNRQLVLRVTRIWNVRIHRLMLTAAPCLIDGHDRASLVGLSEGHFIDKVCVDGRVLSPSRLSVLVAYKRVLAMDRQVARLIRVATDVVYDGREVRSCARCSRLEWLL